MYVGVYNFIHLLLKLPLCQRSRRLILVLLRRCLVPHIPRHLGLPLDHQTAACRPRVHKHSTAPLQLCELG